jgi:hypothetical protein
MSAIGPGDWVECVQNRRPTTQPPVGLVVGGVYLVVDAGVTPPDDYYPHTPWVRLASPAPRPGKLGFRAAWFRPVHRPQEHAFDYLLENLPAELEREGVSA